MKKVLQITVVVVVTLYFLIAEYIHMKHGNFWGLAKVATMALLTAVVVGLIPLGDDH